MKTQIMKRVIISLLQIAIIIFVNSILPLGDGWLPLWGMIFIIVANYFKYRFSGWGIVLAYPIAYILAILLDTPHPINGSLPNNMYSLWYLIFIGTSIVFLILEFSLKIKKIDK